MKASLAFPIHFLKIYSVNLYENIERLNLAVDQILPLHGRIVPLAELQKAIGKTS